MKVRMMIAFAALAAMCAWSIGATPGPKPTHNPTPKPSPTPTPADKADKLDAQGATTAVYKFVDLHRGNTPNNHPCLMLRVTPVLGGAPIEMIIQNKSNVSNKVDPDDAIHAAVKGAKPDDLLEISLGKMNGQPAVVSAAKFVPKAGEDEPNVFIFNTKTTQKVNKEDRPAVTLTKYLVTSTLLVPGKLDPAAGKTVPDANILAKIDGFKSGDMVEVINDKSAATLTVKSIAAYVAPRKVTFVKVARQTVNDRIMVGIEVKDAGTTQTLYVDPLGTDATALTNAIGDLKPDQAVMVRSATDDKGTWLMQLKPAKADKSGGN